MEELIKKIRDKTLEELEKVDRPAFPLYYKEVFNNIAKDEGIIDQLNPKLLCIETNFSHQLLETTKKVIDEVQNTSKNIKTSSKDIIEEINEADPEEVKESVIKYSAYLLNTVNELENKIKELEDELDKAYRELLIDPLTRVYNRKALERDLENILKEGKNKNLDLVVAFLDMDNFKEINDNFGHLVGDFVLIKFAKMLKSLTRSTDRVYRYGGDEFVIVFNRTNLDSAIKIIERIIEKIRKTKLKYKDYLIEFTISVGLTAHKKGDSVDSLLKRADDALYEAKVEKNTYKVNE